MLRMLRVNSLPNTLSINGCVKNFRIGSYNKISKYYKKNGALTLKFTFKVNATSKNL